MEKFLILLLELFSLKYLTSQEEGYNFVTENQKDFDAMEEFKQAVSSEPKKKKQKKNDDS